MPDTRRHRGAHPRDAADFSAAEQPRLRAAVADLAWLLGRGYPARRSGVLVGDRHALRERQRKAVGRCAAAPGDVAARRQKQIAGEQLRGERLWVDGYNVLLTVEAALGGGVVLRAMDDTLRDMAAMSSHYKRVEETTRALTLLGEHLRPLALAEVRWLLDRPISNSGRLRALMLELAGKRGWPWRVELEANPDAVLKDRPEPIATADSAILDTDVRFFNLARHVVGAAVPDAWIVDLTRDGALPLRR